MLALALGVVKLSPAEEASQMSSVAAGGLCWMWRVVQDPILTWSRWPAAVVALG